MGQRSSKKSTKKKHAESEASKDGSNTRTVKEEEKK